MGLFRPYERTETGAKAKPTSLTPKDEVAAPKQAPQAKAEQPPASAPGEKKSVPTPTRKAAEAARMERLHPTTTKREARKKARLASRAQSEHNWQQLERSSERALLRDFVDSRWTLVEFMLPSMLVFLAVTMLSTYAPQYAIYVTAVLWLFLILAVLNVVVLWRKFKAELAARIPKASARGLLMYLINRAMMIRRFRQPRPRISRGDSY